MLRMRSSAPLQDCVKNGYVIGRDDETKARANIQILGFLSRVFGMRPS